MPPCALIALALAGLIQLSSGFSPLLLPTGRIPSPRQATHLEAEQGWRAPPRALGCQSRRECLGLLLGPAPFLAAVAAAPKPAAALVKGSAPPPKGGSSSGATGSGRPKCKSVDECEALGEARSNELFADSEEDAASVQRTPQGDRFKDLVVGVGPDKAERGASVRVKYRVLRLGKRSRDGLSGEASPIFSIGYGEDDDKETDVAEFIVGQGNVVPAIEAGLLGMRGGGRRRVNVRPERGWKLPENLCLRTDSAVSQAISLSVVPGTQVQENDACFAENLVPRPGNYGAKRRMLRRYDETLIVDVEVVSVTPYKPE